MINIVKALVDKSKELGLLPGSKVMVGDEIQTIPNDQPAHYVIDNGETLTINGVEVFKNGKFAKKVEQKEMNGKREQSLQEARTFLEENGYYVYPKSVYGDFPNLGEFGELLEESPVSVFCEVSSEYGPVFLGHDQDDDSFEVFEKDELFYEEETQKSISLEELFRLAGLDSDKYEVVG